MLLLIGRVLYVADIGAAPPVHLLVSNCIHISRGTAVLREFRITSNTTLQWGSVVGQTTSFVVQ